MNGERPNGFITWQNLLAAIGGAVSISGLFGGVLGGIYIIYGRDMDQIRAVIDGIADREIERIEEDAYHRGQIDQKITDARSAIASLDVTLQREMRLLDDTGNSERVALDRRLQNEIRTVAEVLTSRVDAVRQDQDASDARQRELREWMAELRAGFDHQNKGP
jgi:hypothetical protein